jgi:hypothetical protein
MRILDFAFLATVAGCTAAPPPPASPIALPELAGRTAGAPERCVTTQHSEGLHVAGPHTLTYRDGRTIWVNAVPECSPLKYSDILVVEPVGSQYCRGDFVRTRDNQSFLPGPGCRLSEFVPYRKP